MSNSEYAIEMVNITKRFPGIIANDNVTLQQWFDEAAPGRNPRSAGGKRCR